MSSQRKIRLCLHGQRLPPDYTISLRILPANNHTSQPKAFVRKRWRKEHFNPSGSQRRSTFEFDVSKYPAADSDVPIQAGPIDPNEEDERICLSNAYPGAENSVGSIHQRRWFLSMDRRASGFSPVYNSDGSKKWKKLGAYDRVTTDGREETDDGSFVVLGRDVERSIVTGRTAGEVMRDEGVEGFVGRKGWRAVVE